MPPSRRTVPSVVDRTRVACPALPGTYGVAAFRGPRFFEGGFSGQDGDGLGEIQRPTGEDLAAWAKEWACGNRTASWSPWRSCVVLWADRSERLFYRCGDCGGCFDIGTFADERRGMDASAEVIWEFVEHLQQQYALHNEDPEAWRQALYWEFVDVDELDIPRAAANWALRAGRWALRRRRCR